MEEEKELSLPDIDMSVMTIEDKRKIIQRMILEGFDLKVITDFSGYTFKQVKKIEANLKTFAESSGDTSGTYDEPDEVYEGWSKNERHYVEGGANLKYRYETLSRMEQKIYRDIEKEELKKQFRNETERTNKIPKKVKRTYPEADSEVVGRKL